VGPTIQQSAMPFYVAFGIIAVVIIVLSLVRKRHKG
jgi:hypothetical protein